MSRENTLMKLLYAFPEENWNYTALSGNPNISLDYVRSYMDKINFKILTSSFLDRPELILANPDLPFDIEQLYDARINIELLRKYADRISFKWLCVHNSYITPDIIHANPDLFNIQDYLHNKSITIETLVKYPTLHDADGNKVSWDYDWYAAKIGISTDKLIEYIEKQYTQQQLDMELFLGGVDRRFDILSRPNVPLDVIEKHLHLCPQPISIHRGSLITWDFIKRQPLSTKWRTIDLVRMLNEHKMYSMIYDVLMNCCGSCYSIIPSEKLNLPEYIMNAVSFTVDLEFMIEYPFEWNWLFVISRKDVSWEDIVKHKLHKMADPSHNPNITAEIVLNNPQIDWNFGVLSGNRFGYSENAKN
jgi:hypothetical protein